MLRRSNDSAWRSPCLALVFVLLVACGDDDDNADSDRNPQLSALVLSAGTLTPAFDSSTFDYTAEVANDVPSITVTPTAANPAATVQVNGTPVASGSASAPVTLNVGSNDVTILVTAENGTTERAYTVTVTRREPPSSNAGLLDLELTVAPLDQIFDPSIMSYTAAAGYLGASTRVIAQPEDDGATVAVAGVSAPPGAPSDYVALAPGDTTFDVVVTAEDGVGTRTYSIIVTRADVSTLQQEAYLKASSPGPDLFASSLGLSGSILAVGAPAEASAATGVDGNDADDSLAQAGAVYLFQRNVSTWMQAAYVKASNTDDLDRFGSALAIDGDLLTVTAPGERSLATGIDGDEQDDSGTQVGAAYLFTRDGMNVWSQAAYLKPFNSDSQDQFGIAVGLSAGRVVVGADLEDGNASGVDGDGSDNSLAGAGAAYLFGTDASGGWQQQAYLKASNTGSGDRFGAAVAISGDLVVIGAPLEDGSATGVDGDDDNALLNSGAVYLFTLDDDGQWSQSAYLKASNTDGGDQFGAAVAVDGNLVAVGAPGEDSAASGIDGDAADDTLDAPGAVYVFERGDDDRWSQIAYLKASDPDSLDNFGTALALRGNLLAVAAPFENSAAVGVGGDDTDDSALNAGAVYLFERAATGDWAQIAYVKASNTEADDAFGTSVALDGDTLAAGAPAEDGSDTGVNGDDSDNGQVDAGAGYVIR